MIVDSASGDGTLQTVADLRLDAIGLNENRGFGYACNVGWQRCDAPYVLFLNPDATISEAAVRQLVATIELDPAIAAAAPRIVDSDGALDYSIRHFPRPVSTFAQALFLHRIAPSAGWTDELIRDPAAYAQEQTPDWVSGACILVRRAVLETLDGFDEEFFMYCEDADLCRRARDLGLEIRFDPAAVAVHQGGASRPRAFLLPVLATSRIRYAAKHASPVGAFLERLGVALGALTHALFARGGVNVRIGWLRALARALSPNS